MIEAREETEAPRDQVVVEVDLLLAGVDQHAHLVREAGEGLGTRWRGRRECELLR